MADQPNDIFAAKAAEPQQAPAATQPAATTDFGDLLKLVRNDNGEQKYDSIPKALEGLVHAQQYIPQLQTTLQQKEAELAQLRAELAQKASVEEVVSRLTATQQTSVKDEPPVTSGLDQQAVVNLIQQTLSQSDAQKSAQANILKVQQSLSSKYGDKTVEVLEAKARELGTTRQELGELASRNPAMVLALFNVQASPGAKPTTGSVSIPSSYQPQREELKRPEKSLLSGSTSSEQRDFMRKIKEDVYAKYGVTLD